MVIGRNNRVVGLTTFQTKKMIGRPFGTQKVALVTRWLYGGVALIVNPLYKTPRETSDK